MALIGHALQQRRLVGLALGIADVQRVGGDMAVDAGADLGAVFTNDAMA